MTPEGRYRWLQARLDFLELSIGQKKTTIVTEQAEYDQLAEEMQAVFGQVRRGIKCS